jgi:hypothetical protein
MHQLQRWSIDRVADFFLELSSDSFDGVFAGGAEAAGKVPPSSITGEGE